MIEPKRWPNARIIALLAGAFILAILGGCGSGASPRAVDQRPVLSQYKGWVIGVTLSRIENYWRARARVWPPEVHPETHPGIDISFNGASTNRQAVEQAATAAARGYIDASLPAERSNVPNAAEIPTDQPPVMSEYMGWNISVTPSVVHSSPDLWRARVRVWPPEVRPETHPGIGVNFTDSAAERSAVEQAATVAARRYIDASISVHPR